MAVVQGLNRPFFHIDLTSAVQSAIATVEHQNQLRAAEQPVDEDMKGGI
jgi:sodium-independent sulfate anion transporter 11